MTYDVDKRLMLRRPKVPKPVLRIGVTRMGKVGMQYEHQGVKGWGASESAARAAWEQNMAMRKSDSWEVPADHFEAAVPRKRPNYGAGNTVGKRMTGASTGVASAKKLGPTRSAPRAASASMPKVGAMPMVNGRRLNPADVGKRFFSAGQRRKMAARGQANPDGSYPIKSQRDVVNAERLLHHSSPGKQAEVRSRIRSFEASKRDRRYDPEANRQRRLGAAAAGVGIGGAAAVGSGAREIRRTRGTTSQLVERLSRPGAELRERNPMIGPLNQSMQRRVNSGRAKRPLGPWESVRVTDAERDALRDVTSGIRVTRHSGGRLALGTGLLAASAGLANHGRSRANRRYY